jgi:uncharacterized protein YxjI
MDPFALDQYLARRKVFTLFTGKFHIYDLSENLIAYVEQKAFKLKEDITVFADEEKQNPLLNIKAQQVLDISAAYAVIEVATGTVVGHLKRKGLKSILRDEWTISDINGQDIGRIQEDSALVATLRRFLPLANLIPQSYNVEINGQPSGTLKQNFNPFVMKLNVDLRADPGRQFDRRLALAAVVLLLAIEGRQG